VLLPFVGEGVSRVFVRNEHALGIKMRFLFGFAALALIAYCAVGLLMLAI
jgi:hypothetical protein